MPSLINLLLFFMDNKKIFWKNAMNYGAILGAITVGLTLIFYLTNFKPINWVKNISFVFFIYYGTKILRDKYYGGFITYNKAVGSGTMISIYAGIILSFFSFILLNYIAPELKEETMRVMEEELLNRGMSEDEVELFVSAQDSLSNPIVVMFSGIFGYSIIGLVISLFTSIFLKVEPNPFQNIGNDDSENNSTNQISEQ